MTPTLSTTTWTPAADRADLTRTAVTAAIPDLTWTDTPGPDAVRLADALGLPEVTRAAVGTTTGWGLVAVEVVDPAGRNRVYAVTHGQDRADRSGRAGLVVVAAEFTPHP